MTDLYPALASDEPMQAPGGTLWGYPKGVMLLSLTEMWERFSYFGMLAILVLFLTTQVSLGGFGWSESEALRLYGFYSGLAFTVPLLGGWIANNYWGERRCIVIGAVLIACGHALLAGPTLVPSIAQHWTHIDYRQLWISAEVTLGHLVPHAQTQQQLALRAASIGIDAAHVLLVYRLIALTFLGGLGLIILGTMLLKPTISSIIGQFFGAADSKRDAAFALFLVGIYIGEIAGVFVTGFLGERVAWHFGFSAAGIGMMAGLLLYLGNQRRYLGDIGVAPVGKSAGANARRR